MINHYYINYYFAQYVLLGCYIHKVFVESVLQVSVVILRSLGIFKQTLYSIHGGRLFSFCCPLRECLVSVNTYKSYAPLCCLFISSTCMTFPHVWGIRCYKQYILNSFSHGEILWGLNLMCVLRWWNCLSVLSQVELDECPNLVGRIFSVAFLSGSETPIWYTSLH